MSVNSTQTPNTDSREYAAASILSAAAGFADALGYLASGVFAANMTGNTVLGAMALAEGHFLLAAERFCTLVAFFAGAMLARAILHWRRASIASALAVEAAILLSGAMEGVHSFAGLQVMALAMGIQASAMTRFVGAQVSTVVITSTLARLAESVTDRMGRVVGSRLGQNQTNVRLLMATWVFYAVGAAFAVLAISTMGSTHALAFPALAVLVVAWTMRHAGHSV